MEKLTPKSSLLDDKIPVPEQPASWQQLVNTILPNNLNEITQSLDTNILQAEKLMAQNLQATYALLNRARVTLQSASSNPDDARTFYADASVINGESVPPSGNTLQRELTMAPDVEQRMNAITQSINARFNQLAQQIAEKSQSVAQLAATKAVAAMPVDDVIEGEFEIEGVAEIEGAMKIEGKLEKEA